MSNFEDCLECPYCNCSIFEKIEVNRYSKETLSSRYIIPWYLFRCIKCSGLTFGHGHEDDELKAILSANKE